MVHQTAQEPRLYVLVWCMCACGNIVPPRVCRIDLSAINLAKLPSMHRDVVERRCARPEMLSLYSVFDNILHISMYSTHTTQHAI